MANTVTAEVVKGNLIITLPFTSVKDAGMSKSGKSKVVATSNGFQNIDVKGVGIVGVSLNVIVKL